MDWKGKHVIISRTDSIGDVMLTLPICTWIKLKNPTVKITFLGRAYTKCIIESYAHVDFFEDWDQYVGLRDDERKSKFTALKAEIIIHVFPNKEISSLAKKIKIPVRIGTSHRGHHIRNCNFKVNFTRKNSNLHESQLNHELLRPLSLIDIPPMEEISKSTSFFKPLDVPLPVGFNNLEAYTILHPKSKGSALEWPMDKYIELANKIVDKGEKVIFTGTEEEGDLFRSQIPKDDNIIDATGALSLEQLIVLIKKAKNFVACSTGPLHISGYLGINTLGLFSPKRPIHPGRWKALGEHVTIVVKDETCPKCTSGKLCDCIKNIDVQIVLENLM